MLESTQYTSNIYDLYIFKDRYSCRRHGCIPSDPHPFPRCCHCPCSQRADASLGTLMDLFVNSKCPSTLPCQSPHSHALSSAGHAPGLGNDDVHVLSSEQAHHHGKNLSSNGYLGVVNGMFIDTNVCLGRPSSERWSALRLRVRERWTDDTGGKTGQGAKTDVLQVQCWMCFSRGKPSSVLAFPDDSSLPSSRFGIYPVSLFILERLFSASGLTGLAPTIVRSMIVNPLIGTVPRRDSDSVTSKVY